MACEGGVGSTNPDIAGLGIIISFAIQAGVSLILSVWAWYLQTSGAEEGEKKDLVDKKRKLVQGVLGSISDIQTFNGIALLIAALTQFHSLDLYHYHVVYDTVNFTSVSFCAALVNLLESDQHKRPLRLFTVAVFSVLYLAFAILFGIALGEWDDGIDGRCYITSNISAPGARHPYVDEVYLGVTCFFLYVVMYSALPPVWDIKFRIRNRNLRIRELYNVPNMTKNMLGASKYAEMVERIARIRSRLQLTAHRLELDWPLHSLGTLYPFLIGPFRPFFDDTYWDELNESKQQTAIMVPIVCQYPLHLYFIFTMRTWNAGLLQGDSEDAWGFGQVVALVLLVPTIQKCVEAVLEYRDPSSDNGLRAAEQHELRHVPADDSV